MKNNKKPNLHSRIFQYIKRHDNLTLRDIQIKFNLEDKFMKKYKILLEDRILLYKNQRGNRL